MDTESIVYELLSVLDEDPISQDKFVQREHIKSRIWDIIQAEIDDRTELE